VTVENLCGSATDTNYLKFLICGINIPNVITPNGDGKNDYFIIENLHHHGVVGLEIYNRWGRRVYETDNYQNDWGGAKNEGSLVPEGVYFYRIIMTEDLFYQGSFTIFYE